MKVYSGFQQNNLVLHFKFSHLFQIRFLTTGERHQVLWKKFCPALYHCSFISNSRYSCVNTSTGKMQFHMAGRLIKYCICYETVLNILLIKQKFKRYVERSFKNILPWVLMVLGPLDLPGNLVCQHYPKNMNTSFILYNCTHVQNFSRKKNLYNYIVSQLLHLNTDYQKNKDYPEELLATSNSKDFGLHSLILLPRL